MHRGLKPYTEDLLKLMIVTSLNHQLELNDKVIGLIKDRYINGVDISDKVASAKALSKITSDYTFVVPHYRTVQYLREAGVKTFAYSYDYVSTTSLGSLFGIRPPLGAGHADDVLLMFNGRLIDMIPKTEETKEFQKKFITLLTDFAKHGDPTINLDVKWPEVSTEDIHVYHIAETSSVTKFNAEKDARFDFWLNKIPNAATKLGKEEL